MIFVALGLLGFGVSDLVRWSPEQVGKLHAAVAAIGGAAAVATIAALSGFDAPDLIRTTVVALTTLWVWSAYDLIPSRRAKPGYALALIFGVISVLVGLGGSAEPVAGEVATWYSQLDFGFSRDVPVDQFVVGASACVFLLATGNRIVRFTLLATRPSLPDEEGTMRGGRLLGPMERLIVAGTVISGDIAGAGFVIAAKGLLRFREIRGAEQPRIDEITEYFLVGTFTSVLVAVIAGLLVLASG